MMINAEGPFSSSLVFVSSSSSPSPQNRIIICLRSRSAGSSSILVCLTEQIPGSELLFEAPHPADTSTPPIKRLNLTSLVSSKRFVQIEDVKIDFFRVKDKKPNVRTVCGTFNQIKTGPCGTPDVLFWNVVESEILPEK